MEKKLPKNWVECALNELALVQSGGTPSRGNKAYWNGNIPWIKISDIKDLYVDEATEYITEEGLANSAARLFPKGTILFTIFATIGRIGILNIEATTNQAIAGITPSNLINHKYLTYSLIDLSNSLQEQGKGVAQKNINQAILKSTLIPLPPLAEQNRIVAKLDALFAQLETIKTSMAKVPLLLKDFRQQVLTQAVTGKLTEEWRKGKDLDEWKEVSSSKLFEFVTSGSRGWAQYYNQDGEQLFVRITNMNYGTSSLDLSPEKLQFLELPYNSEGKRTLLKARDILISITADIGMISLIPNNFPYEAYVNQHVCLARPVKTINEKFLVHYLMSEKGFGQLKDRKKGATKAGLTLGDIKDLNIEIPSSEEQQEIVSRVESLFAKADAIEKQYETLKAKIDTLPQAILHKAFKGELTEQLDSDGDARELLREIQSLRAEQSNIKKKGKKVKV